METGVQKRLGLRDQHDETFTHFSGLPSSPAQEFTQFRSNWNPIQQKYSAFLDQHHLLFSSIPLTLPQHLSEYVYTLSRLQPGSFKMPPRKSSVLDNTPNKSRKVELETVLQKQAQEIYEEKLKGVNGWGPHLQAAFDPVLQAEELSKFRNDYPMMEYLSDDQLLSAYRKAIMKKANEQRAPAVTASASQQPHGHADAADHPSASEEDQELPESSAGHSQRSEAVSGTNASNDGQISPDSVSPPDPSVQPSVSGLGQVSQIIDAVQSPPNIGTQAPTPSRTLGTPSQSETPTSSGNPATPISDTSSSGAPPLLPPAEPGTHQQQQPNPQPVPARGVPAYLKIFPCLPQ